MPPDPNVSMNVVKQAVDHHPLATPTFKTGQQQTHTRLQAYTTVAYLRASNQNAVTCETPYLAVGGAQTRRMHSTAVTYLPGRDCDQSGSRDKGAKMLRDDLLGSAGIVGCWARKSVRFQCQRTQQRTILTTLLSTTNERTTVPLFMLTEHNGDTAASRSAHAQSPNDADNAQPAL
jgi:hypothetical protein